MYLLGKKKKENGRGEKREQGEGHGIKGQAQVDKTAIECRNVIRDKRP